MYNGKLIVVFCFVSVEALGDLHLRKSAPLYHTRFETPLPSVIAPGLCMHVTCMVAFMYMRGGMHVTCMVACM